MKRTLLLILALGFPGAPAALGAEPNLFIACDYDPSESGADRLGTVADGLDGSGVSLKFDFADATVRFRDGSVAKLSKVDGDSIEFIEGAYVVTYRRDTGDLISHDDKTGFDGTFHCVKLLRPS